MKGLLLKDLINLKSQGKVMVVLIAFYVFLALSSQNNAMFGGIISVMAAILPVTALSYDEKAKWDKYALSMPVSRSDMVISKYLLGLLLLGAAFLINMLFNIFAGMDTIKDVFILSYSLAAVGLVFLSLILPILFQFGVEKGRLFMLLVLFLPTAAVIIWSKTGLQKPGEEALHNLLTVSPLLVVAILVLSVLLSLKIYAKKEM